MIRTNTVLVLGAGASNPYGLPLGRELTAAVCTWQNQSVAPEVATLLASCGATAAEVKAFARQLYGSRVKSVDAFIEKQPHLEAAGKLVMAYELCRRENPGAVIRMGISDDWYEHLWDRMHAGCPSMHDLANNKIRFVTFNYDRSLEYFLYRVIMDTYGVPGAAVLEFLPRIEILHLYGQLGALAGPSTPNARDYSHEFDARALATATAGIKIIPEARAGDGDFGKARAWFEWASQIGFMGFGFDETNCQRLGLSSVLEYCDRHEKPPKFIYASTSGMTPQEVAAAKLRICPGNNWRPLDHTCLAFLRHTPLLEST